MKKYKIIFSENALTDMEEIVAYYNEQQRSLGKRFAMQVQITLKSIKRNPFYSRIRYSEIRCATVDFFPFLIHYAINIETKTVRILSVYNTARKPLWE